MKKVADANRLRWNLATVILLKIVFLYAFWQLVLTHEVTHVDTGTMAQRLLSPSTHP